MQPLLLDVSFDFTNVLISILILLIAVVYTGVNTKLNRVDSRGLDHEKRIQRVEDVQGNKIDALSVKIDKLDKSFTDLAYNVHKDKNVENQFTTVLTQILHYMETHNGIKSE